MIKEIAWNTFKNTGNIDTFIEFKNIEDMEEIIEANEDENSKNKWSSDSRKNHSRL